MPAGIARRGGAPTPSARSRDGGPARAAASRGRAELASTAALQVAEIQRSRLVLAAVGALAELGYAHATVARVTASARVSRRTFYELFANREACVVAVLDHVADLISAELAAIDDESLSWRERVRDGLAAILRFLDREPTFAQVCVVQAARGGPLVQARREEIVAEIVAILDSGGRERARGHRCSPLTAEGLVGAALAIVHARLTRGERRPLCALYGELLSMIVLPYEGEAAARRAQTQTVGHVPASGMSAGWPHATSNPLTDVSMRLTYRTIRVLQSVAEHPGASNRQTAQRAGISDAGQVSKLLARLQTHGLLDNGRDSHLKGEPNVWTLTAKGWQVIQGIGLHTAAPSEAA